MKITPLEPTPYENYTTGTYPMCYFLKLYIQ